MLPYEHPRRPISVCRVQELPALRPCWPISTTLRLTGWPGAKPTACSCCPLQASLLAVRRALDRGEPFPESVDAHDAGERDLVLLMVLLLLQVVLLLLQMVLQVLETVI